MTTLIVMSLAVISGFSTVRINSTAVRAMWSKLDSDFVDHYTVYYYPDPAQNGSRKRNNNEQMATFPAGSSSGVIGGLNKEQDYLFSLSVAFNVNEQLFEGERTDPVEIGWMTCNLNSVLSHTNDNTLVPEIFAIEKVKPQLL